MNTDEPGYWYELPCICAECGDQPPAFRSGDTFCALHGKRLKSEAEMDAEKREAARQTDLAEHLFQTGVAINRIASGGVQKW